MIVEIFGMAGALRALEAWARDGLVEYVSLRENHERIRGFLRMGAGRGVGGF